jgi:hypothetical protein
MTNTVKEDNPLMQACEYARYFFSTCIVHILILIAFVGIGNTWCVLKVHPAGNFIMLFGALTLLAYVEALHYGMYFPSCFRVLESDITALQYHSPKRKRQTQINP